MLMGVGSQYTRARTEDLSECKDIGRKSEALATHFVFSRGEISDCFQKSGKIPPQRQWFTRLHKGTHRSSWQSSDTQSAMSRGLLSLSSVGRKAEYSLTIFLGLYQCSQLPK